MLRVTFSDQIRKLGIVFLGDFFLSVCVVKTDMALCVVNRRILCYAEWKKNGSGRIIVRVRDPTYLG